MVVKVRWEYVRNSLYVCERDGRLRQPWFLFLFPLSSLSLGFSVQCSFWMNFNLHTKNVFRRFLINLFAPYRSESTIVINMRPGPAWIQWKLSNWAGDFVTMRTFRARQFSQTRACGEIRNKNTKMFELYVRTWKIKLHISLDLGKFMRCFNHCGVWICSNSSSKVSGEWGKKLQQ